MTKQKRLYLLMLCLWGSSQSLRATLVERDLLAPGDKLVTIDTSSGLEWLDVSQTTGLAFDQVVADNGGWASMGFRQRLCSMPSHR